MDRPLTYCVSCLKRFAPDRAAGRHVKCLPCWEAGVPSEIERIKAHQAWCEIAFRPPELTPQEREQREYRR